MEIDKDIQQLISGIESGIHSIERAIELFVESLPGYDFRLHKKVTVEKYDACLRKGPNCFLKFLNQEGILSVEQIQKEHAQRYKDFLLNKLDPQTVRSFITAERLFFQYLFRIGWLQQDLSIGIRLPKPKKSEHIKTIPEKVVQEVLGGEWGTNTFAVARNNLISHLLLKRGLHPKEFPTILEEHIHPYEDLAYITVYGKRDVPRDVMLDPDSLEALKIYMIERAHFLYERKIKTTHIFISLNPKDDSYAITVSGVMAVVRRIKKELKLKGCLWDLSALNSQGCRRTAVSKDYEMAEDSPIHHPELTLSGQYGHSLQVAQKHYWKKSKKNAYRLVKGCHGGGFEQPPERIIPEKPEPEQGVRGIYPDSSFFRDFGVGI